MKNIDMTCIRTIGRRTLLTGVALCVMLSVDANAYTYNTMQTSTCMTAIQASQWLITGWQLHNRKVASTCAYPLAVNTLFMTQASSQPNAAWRSAGCTWTGVKRASCIYSFEGGAANLALVELNASEWRVISIQFIAD